MGIDVLIGGRLQEDHNSTSVLQESTGYGASLPWKDSFVLCANSGQVAEGSEVVLVSCKPSRDENREPDEMWPGVGGVTRSEEDSVEKEVRMSSGKSDEEGQTSDLGLQGRWLALRRRGGPINVCSVNLYLINECDSEQKREIYSLYFVEGNQRLAVEFSCNDMSIAGVSIEFHVALLPKRCSHPGSSGLGLLPRLALSNSPARVEP
ncbi:unnamed protein product [Protopolystoma xenopodis]|uniref:Uncharacterized protein n=1 Tax=Protopolystoma xenopodis TaxID=117903 RepID=A0A448WZG6_9PLAT|nr:unnamed protein product [Protopolystoma xenopodis]